MPPFTPSRFGRHPDQAGRPDEGRASSRGACRGATIADASFIAARPPPLPRESKTRLFNGNRCWRVRPLFFSVLSLPPPGGGGTMATMQQHRTSRPPKRPVSTYPVPLLHEGEQNRFSRCSQENPRSPRRQPCRTMTDLSPECQRSRVRGFKSSTATSTQPGTKPITGVAPLVIRNRQLDHRSSRLKPQALPWSASSTDQAKRRVRTTPGSRAWPARRCAARR